MQEDGLSASSFGQGSYLSNCEFQTLEVSMFFGIEHTALVLHIGYTIESFLIHVETLPSAHDNKCIPIRILGASSVHAFLVQNR